MKILDLVSVLICIVVPMMWANYGKNIGLDWVTIFAGSALFGATFAILKAVLDIYIRGKLDNGGDNE